MAYSRSRRHGTRMSLEETLEQERRELVDTMEGRQTRHVSESWPSASSSMNDNSGNTTRYSMLEFSPSPGALPLRHGSIAGIGVGVTPPSSTHRRSWNEPILSSPLRLSSTATSPPSTSSATSPQDQEKEKSSGDSEAAPRKSSDGTDRSHERKKSVGKIEKSGVKSPTITTTALHLDTSVSLSSPDRDSAISPTSTPQAQEKSPVGKNTVAAMMSGLDSKFGLPSFARGRDSARRSGASRGSSLDSRLPSRFARSISPRNRWLRTNPFSLATSSLKSTKSTTRAIDMHLSDAALSKFSGGLSSALPEPGSRRGSLDEGSTADDERLEKDIYDSENNPIGETSDEDDFDDNSSSDDESVDRGRKVSIEIISPSDDGSQGDAKEQPQSLLAAAEEERKLVEDNINSTPHDEQKPTLIHSAKLGPQPLHPPQPPKPQQPQVHPRTSFEATSAINTPFGSEDEAELSDIKRAQKLSIQMSSINNSVRNRSIRTIVRGDFGNVLEETEGGRRRRRKYMVTTDLSEESVYALEWTIGTILRDGDTLFAVCAINEETSTGPSVQIGEGAKAMQDSAMVVGSQTEETARKSQNDPSTYLPRAIRDRLGSGSDSKSNSVDAKGISKAESDRMHAVETISQTCVRLLRKTLLQVRIAVEVIHCKSPKHMITEAIDGLAPTLVIVGARGRSALKGVLLGSFSNYLVTKSSVPVMVARRKLKKHTKNKKTNIRLSNNLSTPKNLAMAKID